VPQGIAYIAQRVPALIEDAGNELPGSFRLLIQRLLEHLKVLQQQVDEIEAQIKAWHRTSEASQRLEKVPGIGPLTATALVASIGDAKNFDNGRQFAAWLGVVPRQHSSGGKPTLLGMSKRGDAYLRTMLIHGARSVIYRATQKADADSWLVKLTTRRNKNVAAVAMANKRSNRLGAAGARPRVQVRLRRSLIARQQPTDKENPTADCSGNQHVDDMTGQTVVGTARAGQGTSSACKR
jgi:transposase